MQPIKCAIGDAFRTISFTHDFGFEEWHEREFHGHSERKRCHGNVDRSVDPDGRDMV
jgi:hypothetical protein